MRATRAAACAAALLAACAGGPPPPGWQADAQQAASDTVQAYLAGDSAGEAQHFERAREAISRTGSPPLLARAELLRCAAHAASLQFDPCEGFERLRRDAAAPERAYADYLAGTLQPADVALLPPAQRAAATARGATANAALREMRDPLSRLLAAALRLRAGQADPDTVALAVDTASSQGWRRPLLAWLGVQLALAEKAGDAGEADRVRRRIALASRP